MTAEEKLLRIYQEILEQRKPLKRKLYPREMDRLEEVHGAFLEELALELQGGADEDAWAAALVEWVGTRIQAIPSKRKREVALFDCSLAMVAYFLPLLQEMPGGQGRDLAERICQAWSKAFPGNPVGCATREEIQRGFKRWFFAS